MAKNNYLKIGKAAIRKKITEKVRVAAKEAFDESLEQLKTEVVNHPVSKELVFGNDSNYFSNPKGTLFGLLGFKSSRKPIIELMNFLTSPRGFFINLSRNANGVIANVKGPAGKDMANAGLVVDEWGDGRSWPEVVEQGIPGLSNFLSSKYGRSNQGYQTQFQLNGLSSLGDIPYLTPIFRRFKTRFIKNLNRKLP